MNIEDALEQTRPKHGPTSNLHKLLASLDDDARTKVESEIRTNPSPHHLQKALTLLAKHHRVISGDETITVESIKKRREADQ